MSSKRKSVRTDSKRRPTSKQPVAPPGQRIITVRHLMTFADGTPVHLGSDHDETQGFVRMTERYYNKYYKDRPFRMEIPKDPEPPYDPERDWLTWRDILNERRDLRAQHSCPVPGRESVAAARAAATGHLWTPHPEDWITTSTLVLAAVLTVELADVTILYSEISRPEWPLLIEALNRYPHSRSTASMWLVPALRNFFGEPRETPENLYEEWTRQAERAFRFTLHPKSICFQGAPPRHGLIDLEDRSMDPGVARAKLEQWRIRAHVMNVPERWDVEVGILRGNRPGLSEARIRNLNEFACEALAAKTVSKAPREEELHEWRRFLITAAQDSGRLMVMRRVLRSCLIQLNQALLRRLVTKPVVRLGGYHVRQYDMFLDAIRMTWKHTERLPYETRMKERLRYVVERGWPGKCLIHGQRVGDCRPREVAALLMCQRESLEFQHPQAVLIKIAEARKVMALEHPRPSGKRRGRPPKPQEFNLTPLDVD